MTPVSQIKRLKTDIDVYMFPKLFKEMPNKRLELIDLLKVM